MSMGKFHKGSNDDDVLNTIFLCSLGKPISFLWLSFRILTGFNLKLLKFTHKNTCKNTKI